MIFYLDIREVEMGGGLFATPKHIKWLKIDVKDRNSLDKYILTKLFDSYKSSYKRADETDQKLFDLDFISRMGGIKVYSKLPNLEEININE